LDIFFFVERLLVFASPLSFSLATFLALSAGARRTGFVSRRASAFVESVSNGGSFSGFRSGVTTLLETRAFGYVGFEGFVAGADGFGSGFGSASSEEASAGGVSGRRVSTLDAVFVVCVSVRFSTDGFGTVFSDAFAEITRLLRVAASSAGVSAAREETREEAPSAAAGGDAEGYSSGEASGGGAVGAGSFVAGVSTVRSAASVPNVLRNSATVLEDVSDESSFEKEAPPLQLLTDFSGALEVGANAATASRFGASRFGADDSALDGFTTPVEGMDEGMDEGLFFCSGFFVFFVTAVGSATRVSGATAFADVATIEDGEDDVIVAGAFVAFVSGALVRVAVASAGFCSGTAAWNASRHPMTYATLRTPLTVPRKLGGDTSERYRGTICEDAPTPTPTTSRPIVMAPNESALALINVPIVNGTVVANSAALRPCASASGPMPRPPRKPPATSTETTAPFAATSSAKPRSSAIAPRGALITALWYPNKNAPRHAVATLGTRPGPTSSQSNGFCDAFASPSAVEDVEDEDDDDPLGCRDGSSVAETSDASSSRASAFVLVSFDAFVSFGPDGIARAVARPRGGGLAGLRTTAGLTSAGVATGRRPALTTRTCEKPRLALDVAASANAGRVIAATARETRRRGSSRPARRLCPWTAREPSLRRAVGRASPTSFRAIDARRPGIGRKHGSLQLYFSRDAR
jgi:hypothetical protein